MRRAGSSIITMSASRRPSRMSRVARPAARCRGISVAARPRTRAPSALSRMMSRRATRGRVCAADRTITVDAALVAAMVSHRAAPGRMSASRRRARSPSNDLPGQEPDRTGGVMAHHDDVGCWRWSVIAVRDQRPAFAHGGGADRHVHDAARAACPRARRRPGCGSRPRRTG